MPFMLPGLPSRRASQSELSDYIELLAWANGAVSERYSIAGEGQLSDNFDYDAVAGDDSDVTTDDDGQADETRDYDDEDRNAELVEQNSDELERRKVACGPSGYPFALLREGAGLQPDQAVWDTPKGLVYRYLLLSTRLNMGNNRTHAGVDGTQLLEELAAEVLKNYLGAGRSGSFVFGTATPGGFKGKVDELCRKLGDEVYANPYAIYNRQNDGKLDVVAWIPFADGRPGKLAVFAQCKTGTTWRNSVTHLQPRSFMDKWMQPSMKVCPTRAFVVSESLEEGQPWNHLCHDAGILFDRCRLVDFCDNRPQELYNRLRQWTDAAFQWVKEKLTP